MRYFVSAPADSTDWPTTSLGMKGTNMTQPKKKFMNSLKSITTIIMQYAGTLDGLHYELSMMADIAQRQDEIDSYEYNLRKHIQWECLEPCYGNGGIVLEAGIKVKLLAVDEEKGWVEFTKLSDAPNACAQDVLDLPMKQFLFHFKPLKE